MSKRSALYLGGIFFFTFLWLTPLGVFNSWVPPNIHTGFYSVTTIDGGDDTGYYAFLRSTFIDGDLDFFNERGYAHAEKINPTGYVFNNWQMGQAILFLPFFLIGHALAHLYQSLGYPVTTDGYSAPYYLSTAVASATYLFAGLIFIYRTLRMFTRKRVSMLATLSIWLASPLIYFSFIRQRMAHTTEFFLVAVLIYIWIRFRQTRSPLHYAVIGTILGLLCMTRVINISFFALFAVDLLWEFRWDWKENPARAVKKVSILAGAFGGGFILTMLPQIYCWYQLNGVPFPPRHMKFAGEGLTGFSVGPIIQNIYTLFLDAKWGLLYSMPLAVLGMVGLFLKDEFSRDLRPGLLAYLAGIFGIILLYPEDSASYGHRHLISALPIFALGLGTLIQRFAGNRSNKINISPFIVCLIAVLAQFLMLVQYKVSLPYNHPQFTLQALGSSFDVFWERPEMLVRSSSFFQVLFSPHPDSWNYLDGMFLLLFPFFQLLSLAFILFLFHKAFKSTGVLSNLLKPQFILLKAVFVSAILIVLIAFSAPTMSDSQIQSRLKYLEIAKSGELLFKGGEGDASRIAYIEASQYMPSAWKPYFRIGQAWQGQSNLPEANKFFRMALKFNPGFSPALTLLGNNLKRMGNVEEAEKMLRAAIRSWPLNKYAYDSLAHVLATLDKRPEAIKMLKNAINIDPNYGVGHANLAMIYSSLDNNKKSLEHLNRAIQLGVQGPVIDRIKSIVTQKADQEIR
ncbi:tetratricopeptide repeat protein [Nitrospina gracilis]|nr:tetratricopeptide repeat protein [Nitrospina gracilis]